MAVPKLKKEKEGFTVYGLRITVIALRNPNQSHQSAPAEHCNVNPKV
jgi:hypothetical protein